MSIININKGKSDKIINIPFDTRYKLLLGYTNYYTDNIIKYYDAIEQFKGKIKVYDVINPYYYKMLKDNEDKTVDIHDAFNKKYKVSLNKSNYYKVFELIQKFKLNNIICFDEYTETICNILKIKCNKKELTNVSGNTCIYNIKKINTDYIYSIINNFDTFILKINQEQMLYSTNIQLISDIINNSKECNIFIPKTSNIFINDKYIIFNGIKNVKRTNIINKELLNTIIDMNVSNITTQTVNINNVCKYIINQNFYGDEYDKYLNEQKKCHIKWINEYLN